MMVTWVIFVICRRICLMKGINMWSNTQINYLHDNYGIITAKEIGEHIEKSEKCIRVKASRMGLKSALNHKRKYFFNEQYFSKIDSEEKAYFLGFISADGSVKKGKNGYNVRLYGNAKDIDIFEKFNECVDLNKDIKISYRYDNRKYAELELSSKIMVNELINLGVTPNKTFSIEFPNIEKQYYNHYIRGYFDGDGSIFEMNTGRFGFSIVSGSESMITSIYNILGDVTKINTSIRTDRAYEIKIRSKQNLVDIYNYLYSNANIFGCRKKMIFDKFARGCGLHPTRVNLSEIELCDTSFVSNGVVA